MLEGVAAVELSLRGLPSVTEFVRSVQREAYERGKREGMAEGLMRGLDIDPGSEAGAVLASMVEEGTFP